MAFAGVTVTCHSSYLLPRFSSFNYSSIPLLSFGRFPLFISKECLRVSAYAAGSKWASSPSSLETKDGVWEDPDDGSGSDYDQEDEEEAKENDLDFESNWEEEKNSVTATSTVTNSTTENNYGEDLVKGGVHRSLPPYFNSAMLSFSQVEHSYSFRDEFFFYPMNEFDVAL